MDNYFSDYQKLTSTYNMNSDKNFSNEKNNGTKVPLFNSNLKSNSSTTTEENYYNTRSFYSNKSFINFLETKLYSDDLIILGLLLFFLLQENDDISIYIILILLLIS